MEIGQVHCSILLFLAAVEDWLQVVAPNLILIEASGCKWWHLILIGCIEAIKIYLSSGHPVIALACKRYSRKHLDYREYANLRHTTHFCAGCGRNWYITLQVQGNPLAALGC